MKIERWLENEKKRCIESSTSLKGVVCVKFLDVFWFCFVGLGGWCRGVGSVEELVHKVFGDLVSKCGVSVVSVVDAFDELADFCSCLDHAGKAVFNVAALGYSELNSLLRCGLGSCRSFNAEIITLFQH